LSELFWITAGNPVAREHLESSVVAGVPVESFGSLPASLLAVLDAHADRGRIRCWGARPGSGNVARWEKLAVDDVGLIYTDGEFRFLIRTYAKTQNALLAEAIWRAQDGETWEYMYFFDVLRQISLPTDVLGDALGYEPDWRPQGFSFVDENRLQRAVEAYGSTEALLNALLNTQLEPPPRRGRPGEDPAALGVPYHRANEQPATKASDPFEVDPDVKDRGLKGHAVTQNLLARYVEGRGFSPRSPAAGEPNFDLAWEEPDRLRVAEIKSLSTANAEMQLRLGLGQILRFRHLLELKFDRVQAVLAVEFKPTGASDWRALCNEVGVKLTWPEAFEADLST
jgi:hypothetical protein